MCCGCHETPYWITYVEDVLGLNLIYLGNKVFDNVAGTVTVDELDAPMGNLIQQHVVPLNP